jgi:hypothetical protein
VQWPLEGLTPALSGKDSRLGTLDGIPPADLPG